MPPRVKSTASKAPRSQDRKASAPKKVAKPANANAKAANANANATGTWDRSRSTNERHAEQREKLLFAAAEAVGAYGFFGARASHVVRLARVSRRTLFEHFPSLEALFVELHAFAADLVVRGLEVAVAEGTSPRDRIDRAVSTYLEMSRQNAPFARAMFRESNALGSAHVECRERVLSTMAALLSANVAPQAPRLRAEPVAAKKAAKPAARADLEARVLVSSIEYGTMLLLDLEDPVAAEDGRARLVSLVVRALGIPP